MPSKSITVLNGDGSTRTITIPDRSRYAGRRTISKNDGTSLTVDRTAPVVTSDRAGESRPLLSKVVGGATAAYSLRDLKDRAGNNKVARIRRSDNVEVDLLGNGKVVNVPSSEENEAEYPFMSGDTWHVLYSNDATQNIPPSYFLSSGSFSSFNVMHSTLGAIEGTVYATRQINRTFKTGDTFKVTRTTFFRYPPGFTYDVDADFFLAEDHANATTAHGVVATTPLSWDTNVSGGSHLIMTYTGTADLVNPWLVIRFPPDSLAYATGSFQVSGAAGDTYANTIRDFVTEMGGNHDAFVETLYDQSGNGYHATQSALTYQPKIAENGVVFNHLLFDGTDDYLRLDSDLSVHNKPLSVFTVQDRQSTSTRYTVGNITSGRGVGFAYNGYKWFMTSDSLSVVDSSLSQPVDEQAVRTAIHTDDGSSHQISGYYNGTLFTDDDTTSSDGQALGQPNSATTINVIGAAKPLGSGPSYFAGKLTTLVLFDTDQTNNRPAIEANLANNSFITID